MKYILLKYNFIGNNLGNTFTLSHNNDEVPVPNNVTKQQLINGISIRISDVATQLIVTADNPNISCVTTNDIISLTPEPIADLDSISIVSTNVVNMNSGSLVTNFNNDITQFRINVENSPTCGGTNNNRQLAEIIYNITTGNNSRLLSLEVISQVSAYTNGIDRLDVFLSENVISNISFAGYSSPIVTIQDECTTVSAVKREDDPQQPVTLNPNSSYFLKFNYDGVFEVYKKDIYYQVKINIG